MRNKILSLLLGFMLLLTPLYVGAEDDIVLPIPGNDTTVETTLNVKFDYGSLPVQFKNSLEALTEEQINRIVTTFEESGDVSIETFLLISETLTTFNSLLEEKAFLQNKVIYQADEHYNLSESEVKRSLRRSEWLKMIAYGLILAVFIQSARNTKTKAVFINGFIRLESLASIMLVFFIEVFIIWYILRPAAGILINRDFEIIKFLLQGA